MRIIPRQLHFYYLRFPVLSSHLFSLTLTVHNYPHLISDSKIPRDKSPTCDYTMTIFGTDEESIKSFT